MYNEIPTILGHLMTGTVSDEEMERLEAWAQADDRNQQLLAGFLHRHDLLSVYQLPEKPLTKKRQARRLPRMVLWSAAIAASVLLLAGLYRYYAIAPVAPELSANTLKAIENAVSSGHNHASVTIVHGGEGTLADSHVYAVGNDSVLNAYASSYSGQSAVDKENLAAVVTTHHDKEFWLTLPDGTRAHLNYSTTLTYPLSFSGDSREVQLDGEAYFFVAKDNRHPFVVKTRYGVVRDYGTEFDVTTIGGLSTDSGELGVVLVKGSVGVTGRKGQEHRLTPGTMVIIRPDGHTDVKPVDTMPYTAWNNGTFSFDDCRMDRLMSVIGHWYGKRIVFKDPNARMVTFTGDIDRYGLDIEDALHAIAVATGMKITLSDKNIVVASE